MSDDKAVTKGDTYHSLRTKLAYVRFRLSRPITNPILFAALKRDESALLRRMDVVKQNGGAE